MSNPTDLQKTASMAAEQIENSNYSEGGHGHVATPNAYDKHSSSNYRGGTNSGEDYGRSSRADFEFDLFAKGKRLFSNSHWNQEPAHVVGETYQNFEEPGDADYFVQYVSTQQSGSRYSSTMR